jgi:HlyD family secretion protein
MKWLLLCGFLASVASIPTWHILLAERSADPNVSAAPSPPVDMLVVQGVGYVEPDSEVRKLMMRTGGVIKKCNFRVGELVRKDQVILELENATQSADFEVARKNVVMLQADAANVNAGVNPYQIKVIEQAIERLREKLRHCKVEAERHRTMRAAKSASQQGAEAAETLFRQAEVELKEKEAELEHLKHFVIPENRAWQQARVQHAQASLALAEERLRETKLLAPFDGTVLKLLKQEGEGVRSFEPEAVILFGDLSKLRVRAEIDERFVTQLEVGQEAIIYGRNVQGRSYQGKVVLVEKIMGDKTVFSRASSERKDLHVLQALIEMGPEFKAPAGLQVDVKITQAATGTP